MAIQPRLKVGGIYCSHIGVFSHQVDRSRYGTRRCGYGLGRTDGNEDKDDGLDEHASFSTYQH